MNTQYRDFFLTSRDVSAFKRLLDDNTVKEFLDWDRCSMVADKYLIAMALTYFKRGNFSEKQFTPLNLFVSLYLAHDMEEDDLDLKNDLIRFGVGEQITEAKVKLFLQKRDKLWHALNFRAAVNRFCCEEIMKHCLPTHSVWRRTRAVDHGGVNVPFYVKEAVHRELRLSQCFSYSVTHVRCIVCEVHLYLFRKRHFNASLIQQFQCNTHRYSSANCKIRRIHSFRQINSSNQISQRINFQGKQMRSKAYFALEE